MLRVLEAQTGIRPGDEVMEEMPQMEMLLYRGPTNVPGRMRRQMPGTEHDEVMF